MDGWQSLGQTDDLPACVYPLNDLREHDADSPACWCHPLFDDGILIHNSMDLREEYERGERKPS